MTQPDPTAVLARIQQMADYWEQHLPEVIRTPAVVSALRAALEPASAVVAPPTDRAARDRIAEALLTTHHREHGYHADCVVCAGDVSGLATAVLAVLPEQADRAAVRAAAFEEAADFVRGLQLTRTSITTAALEAELRRLAVEAHDTGTQQQCPEREPLIGVQCSKQAGHEAHSDRPGRIWYPVPDPEEQAARCPHGCDVTRCPCLACEADDTEAPTTALVEELEQKADGWREQAFQNSQALAAALATIDRVRQLHDRLAEETDLTSPDDSITRDAAAKRIATALDGWTQPAPVAQQQPETEAPDRRVTVEYFVQEQQPDGTWEDASSMSMDRGFATDRLTARRQRRPDFTFRLAERTTTVVVRPLVDDVPAPVAQEPAAPKYPHPDGDVTVLGPEVFASADGDTISWRGENYVRAERTAVLRIVEAEQQAAAADGEETRCTCADAGDCFAPAGHYADCPAAEPTP